MKDYKVNTYRRQTFDPVLIAFVAICLGYIVVGMAWHEIAEYFGF